MTISQQKKYAFWFGAIFIILLFSAFVTVFMLEIHKEPNLFSLFVFFFRVVLAGSLAGVAATIPGYFDIEWTKKLGIRAGGAFAVFLLIYMVNPPQLIANYSEEEKSSDLFIGCDQLKGGVEPSNDTENYCLQLAAEFPNHWKSHLGLAKLSSVKKEHSESLEHALDAFSAFNAMNRISVFDAVADSESEYHFDARSILHTLKVTAWGAGAFGLSELVVSRQKTAGVITIEKEVFLQKFSAAQKMQRGLTQLPVQSLFQETNSNIDYEYFYNACLLSWRYLVSPDPKTLKYAVQNYEEFKHRLSARDGVNASTQRDHIACLEKDAANLGENCGSSIGVPSFCPIFNLL